MRIFGDAAIIIGMRIRYIAALATCLFFVACGSKVPTPANINQSMFPQVRGSSLKQEAIVLPDHYLGKPTLLLIGYVQKAQFDIDRWILGALQAGVKAEIVEVPTIAGMMPQMVQSFIDNGMRSGIPQSDWGSVVTVYEDAPKIIAALGNDRPQSAYVVLLNREGRIVWTTNTGYSAGQVFELKAKVDELERGASR